MVADGQFPEALSEGQDRYRIVLITQDMQTPFWDKVAKGAKKQAEELGISIEIWGTYGKNQEDFLKNIDVAIQSKVDGIIIQGLDIPELKELTKVKASFHGIPIITVANDVPMVESLRRTYVGSNQYEAGKMIARELLHEMGREGKIVLMYDQSQEFYQRERMKGIRDVLKYYHNIEMIDAETVDSREQVIITTQDVLNKVPDADSFIAINANHLGPMLAEISKRSQVEPYHIYSFDDGPESLALLAQGKVDGIIEQEPEKMGEWSVRLLKEWLEGETVPLEKDGYFTKLNTLKSENQP